MVFNLEVAGPTEVMNHLRKGRQKIFYTHSCITFALSEFRWESLGYSGLLQWVAVQKGLKINGLNASAKIRSDIWTHLLPTVMLYSMKLLKIHMWVAPKRETVIEGIHIINSPASKVFQAHVLTRTGGINWKTIGKKFDFSCNLSEDCGWMALLTRFWVASAGIFSTQYNLNIYTENSFKLLHILQVIKKIKHLYRIYKIYKNDSNLKRIRFLTQLKLLLTTWGNSTWTGWNVCMYKNCITLAQ